MMHDDPGSGHLGVKRTVARLRSRFYWVGRDKSVIKYCQECSKCQARRRPVKTAKSPLKQYQVGSPNERIEVDIVGPLPVSHNGNKYIIVMTDCFTKYANAYPVPEQTAERVALAVLDWVSHFGVMKIIHTDQGRQFESVLFQKLCQLLNIAKTRTTAFNPSSDGGVERFNRTLGDMLSKYVQPNQKDWDDHIPMVLLAYRSSVHESTKQTPAMMTFGRHPDLPADLVFGTPDSKQNKPDVPEFVNQLQQSLTLIHHIARAEMIKAGDRQKRHYDVKLHKVNYKVGDPVWLFNPSLKKKRSRKLHSPWTGPWIVTDVLSDLIIGIQQSEHGKRQIVHHNRLKPYRGEYKSWLNSE